MTTNQYNLRLRVEKAMYFLYNMIPVKEDELQYLFKELGYADHCRYGCFLLQSSQTDTDFHYYERCISHTLSRLHGSIHAVPFPINAQPIGVLVAGKDELCLAEYAKAIQREMETVYKLNINIVIGGECDSASQLHAVVQRAKHCMPLVRPFATDNIINPGEESVIQSDFPKMLLEGLLRTIYFNNQAELMSVLEDIDKRFSSATITIGEIKSNLVVMFGAIMHTVYSEGADFSYVGFDTDFAYQMFHSYTWAQMRKPFNEFCLKIMRIIGKRLLNAMEGIVQYVNNNFAKPLSLNAVASAFDFSPSHISTSFKQYTGLSFSTYVIRLRMEKSKELLRQREPKVHQIARMVGYDDHSYFSRQFKRYTGLNPSDYRRRHLAELEN